MCRKYDFTSLASSRPPWTGQCAASTTSLHSRAVDLSGQDNVPQVRLHFTREQSTSLDRTMCRKYDFTSLASSRPLWTGQCAASTTSLHSRAVDLPGQDNVPQVRLHFTREQSTSLDRTMCRKYDFTSLASSRPLWTGQCAASTTSLHSRAVDLSGQDNVPQVRLHFTREQSTSLDRTMCRKYDFTIPKQLPYSISRERVSKKNLYLTLPVDQRRPLVESDDHLETGSNGKEEVKRSQGK